MRKLALLLPLLAASTFAATSLQTLGARSAHHQLRLERQPSPERVTYNVVVEDLDSGAVLMNSRVGGRPGEALDVTSQMGTKQVRVHLADTAHFFTARVDVIEGKKLIDEFRTWWQLEPRDLSEGAASASLPPTMNAPNAYRVGGDVKAPITIRRVEPIYTAEARHDGISGIVILEVVIGKDGNVKDAAVLKGLPEGLSESAINAVRQWQFRPGTLNGEPVEVIFNLTINFML